MDEPWGGSDGRLAAAEGSGTHWRERGRTGGLPVVELGIPGIRDAREIGWGGSAVVYRAVDRGLHREVAVKLLDARNLDEVASTRFRREARALGALTWHPHIVSVHGTGVTGRGRPYLVMEYARGSLAERIAATGPLRWQEAVHIGVQVAGALEAAHRAGVLHCDVKPENVLIGAQGEPKLADFGIARLEGHEESTPALVTATPAHSAPEILWGAEPSAATAVDSRGAPRFTLLCGRPPFAPGDGEPVVALARRIAEDAVPDLRGAGVPASVCAVVERALSKEPGDRQPSAEAFGRELQEAQAQTGVPVTRLVVEETRTAAPAGGAASAPEARGFTLASLRLWQRATAVAAAALVVGSASLIATGTGGGGGHAAPPAATPASTPTIRAGTSARPVAAGPDAGDVATARDAGTTAPSPAAQGPTGAAPAGPPAGVTVLAPAPVPLSGRSPATSGAPLATAPPTTSAGHAGSPSPAPTATATPSPTATASPSPGTTTGSTPSPTATPCPRHHHC